MGAFGECFEIVTKVGALVGVKRKSNELFSEAYHKDCNHHSVDGNARLLLIPFGSDHFKILLNGKNE